MQLRELVDDDMPAAFQLGALAFGYAGQQAPPEALRTSPHAVRFGVFDASGRMVAKATDRHERQAYGGRWVDVAGVAGVAVAPEERGRGAARRVLTGLIRAARERGAAASPLYPTAPVVYRALGWEVVGSLMSYRVPALALAPLRVPAEMTLRRVVEADVEAVREVYRAASCTTDGLLDRDVALRACTPGELLARADGHTAAIGPEGRLEGYAAWKRGPGYNADSVVEVSELLASTARGYAALLAMLGSWAPVAPSLTLTLLDGDSILLPTPLTSHARQELWMSRILDAGRAVGQRGWPAGTGGAVDLDLVDELVPEHAGAARLVVEDGTGRWEPGGRGGLRLHVRALAVLLAGGSTTGALRRAGLLTGDAGAAATLDAWCARPRPQMLDYF